jgi:hypothetical protein
MRRVTFGNEWLAVGVPDKPLWLPEWAVVRGEIFLAIYW